MRIYPAQRTQTAEDIGKYIKSKFDSDADRLRAAYSWVAQHINYDISQMQLGVTYKHESEVVKQVLKTRKTICFGYALTLKAILANLGIKTIIIRGYTKQNGKIDEIPHAWCAIKYNGEWRLIDPTWSSGYFSSGTLHKKFDDKWYLVEPDRIISSHIPFDPVWQFSHFPINHSEFDEGIRADSVTSRFFNYPDTISIIEKSSEKECLIAENRRVRSMGINNPMITKHIKNNTTYIEHIEHDENVTVFNKTADMYNLSVSLYNKGSANNLKTAMQKLNEASEIIDGIRTTDKDMALSIKNLKKMINKLKSQIETML
jgi:transglutaminase/protease-like cytokinesis protein 3